MNAVDWLMEAVRAGAERQLRGWPSPRSRTGESAQGLIEYALLIVFIAIAVITAVTVLGHGTSNLFSNITNALNSH